ncbi:MAG: hypothetical protein IJ736_14035 [Firmicutes bacterium]|nr:hypothetical protein [Bacillota bacterium]
MYNLKSKSKLRYIATCIINHDIVRVVESIVDTGALYTCYAAKLIDTSLEKEDFIKNESKIIGGFVYGKNNGVEIYRYGVKQFTIGNVDMGSREIWITFDKRVEVNVLGMDILRSVNYLQFDNSDEMVFFSGRDELLDYVTAACK